MNPMTIQYVHVPVGIGFLGLCAFQMTQYWRSEAHSLEFKVLSLNVH